MQRIEKQDPYIFYRLSLENAVDAGDARTALDMSRAIDRLMLRLNHVPCTETPQQKNA